MRMFQVAGHGTGHACHLYPAVIWALYLVNAMLSLQFYLSLCLSNGHFRGGPGLAGSRMSLFWILLELRIMEVVVTIGAIRHAKL